MSQMTPPQPTGPADQPVPGETTTSAAPPVTPEPTQAGDVRRDDRHDKRGKQDDPLRHTRTSGAWTAVILAAVLIVLLVIFVVQNTESVPLRFLWLDGNFPLAAALLIATAVGMVVVAAVGSLRILQLRRRVKREQKVNRGR
jgi:uncharacterized integral membrane protein